MRTVQIYTLYACIYIMHIEKQTHIKLYIGRYTHTHAVACIEKNTHIYMYMHQCVFVHETKIHTRVYTHIKVKT